MARRICNIKNMFRTKEIIEEIDKKRFLLQLLEQEILESNGFLNKTQYSTRMNYYKDIIKNEIFTNEDKHYIAKTHKGLKEILYKIQKK